MSGKTESKKWDIKAAKKLFQEYLEKGIEEKKKEVKLPENTVKIDNLNRQQTLERIYKLTDSIIEMIYENGRPSIKLPSRTSANIIWDEENDLLLLGQQIMEKQFHSLGSVADMTRLMKVLEKVNELLLKDMHATKREIFYSSV